MSDSNTVAALVGAAFTIGFGAIVGSISWWGRRIMTKLDANEDRTEKIETRISVIETKQTMFEQLQTVLEQILAGKGLTPPA